MPTIVVADDHDVVRRGLQVLLSAEPDFSVIGQASDGLETVELVEHLQPDVLVLDVVMPGLNGLEVIRRAHRDSPRTRVVVLSMYDNEAYVVEALQAGAQAYVLKRSPSEELVRAIREAIGGHHYLGSPLSQRAVQLYMGKAKGVILDSYEMLTSREREVLQLAADGCTSAEIAARLSISPRTAETHRASVMHKLGLHTQIQLVRYALRRGLLPPVG